MILAVATVKVLHVIASLDPSGGGPMEGLRQIARAAQAWGETTTVACLDAPGQKYHEGNPFETIALGPSRLGYRYTPRLVPWLSAHAAEFDAVIVHGVWQYHSFGVWRALHRMQVPYFVYPHGMLDPYFKRAYPLKHIKKMLYWRWGEYRVLRDARAVLFTCEEEKLLARESFGSYRCNEQVTGFGTAAPPYERSMAMAAFYDAFPELAGRRTLLFLSRIHEKKGCDLLVQAFAALADAHAGWHLVIAGPAASAYGEKLRALAQGLGVQSRITWTGMLSGPTKWGALFSADAFVLPSHQENFGIAVAESLACATPVLISNRVNIWREIQNDGAGMVAADTLAATTEMLRAWFALEDADRAAMGKNAQTCFAARFDISAVARRLSDTVACLVAAPRMGGDPAIPITLTDDSARRPAVSR